MKKRLSLLLALAMLLPLVRTARADLLWEPSNRFYQEHVCSYLGRAFYANGPDGFVTLLDAPDGGTVEAQYANGAQLWVYWTYGDWGCVTVWEDRDHVDGWVPMDQLRLIYDYLSFAEEYAGEIQDYGGQFADFDGQISQVTFFAYPGAPQSQTTLLAEHIPDLVERLTGSGGEPSYISQIFVDEEGLTWGFVSYLYGRLNAWFCLDDPDGADFPVRAVEEPELIPAQDPVLPARAYLPFLLVGGVMAVTAALLLRFYRRPSSPPS